MITSNNTESRQNNRFRLAGDWRWAGQERSDYLFTWICDATGTLELCQCSFSWVETRQVQESLKEKAKVKIMKFKVSEKWVVVSYQSAVREYF